MSVVDFVIKDAAVGDKKWMGVVTTLGSTESVRSRLVSIEETVGVCRLLGGVASLSGRIVPPTNRPIRSRSMIFGMTDVMKNGVAFVKADRPKSTSKGWGYIWREKR